jgi:spore coat polysaccharide biosynthesis predicted glycosyltransferase SpsG
MHVAFRVDGGPQIGYDHLIWLGSLAEELDNRGHAITVATTTPRPAQGVFPDSTTAVKLQSRGNPEPIVEWLETITNDIVFTDTYPVDITINRRFETGFARGVTGRYPPSNRI